MAHSRNVPTSFVITSKLPQYLHALETTDLHDTTYCPGIWHQTCYAYQTQCLIGRQPNQVELHLKAATYWV